VREEQGRVRAGWAVRGAAVREEQGQVQVGWAVREESRQWSKVVSGVRVTSSHVIVRETRNHVRETSSGMGEKGQNCWAIGMLYQL
jgi:hypothetical protein